MDGNHKVCDFAAVKRAELEALEELGADKGPLVGLAFSGGGIRSATFNLGVLQALARCRLLTRFHYLSTVSGGGYIGSWLSGWVFQEGQRKDVGADEPKLPIARVERVLAQDARAEPLQVTWLRNFSNYLTPRVGLLSADTLQGVATFVRNLILTQTNLALFLGAVLLFPLALMGAAPYHVPPLANAVLAIVLFLFANFFVHRGLAGKASAAEAGSAQARVFWLIVVPLSLAALFFCLWLTTDLAEQARRWWWAYALGAVLLISPASFFARWASKQPPTTPFGVYLLGLACAVLIVSAGALLLHSWFSELQPGMRPWVVPVMGPPAVLLIYLLAVVVHIGISGRGFSEHVREWWGRLGGLLLAAALGWLVLTGAPVYAPFLVLSASNMMAGLGLAWVVSTVSGVIAGASSLTGKPDARPWLNRLTALVPYIFVAGLLVALAFGLYIGLERAAIAFDTVRVSTLPECGDSAGIGELWCQYARLLDSVVTGWLPWAAFGAFFLLSVILAWRVDINLFSFHMYYRNRLTRCYLGAVNPKREADAFTNFDDDDSPRLQDLVQRPYHLVNTALNLTRIHNLAWQERKAAACVLSPLYCGFNLPLLGAASGGPQPQGFYERTDDYLAGKGSLRLGAALSISGAAASPNSGYHTSQAVAFLLTVFNVRLGWWLQNPARPDKWTQPGPRFAGSLLLKELLAFTDERSSYVYLSDGGHFDNLGLYELVRRGCRYIIASDAGMDPKFQFEDLGNAIRKCQIDLGVRIEIGVEGIRPDAVGKSLFHCALGLIHYESSPIGGETGYLLYIKPSLNGNEPTDVAQYRAAHPEFPHQPTSDQWFDESQFESYRRLGRHIGQTVLDDRSASVGAESIADLFVRLHHRWYPPSPATREAFSRHVERLHRIQTEIRSDKDLTFLDAQVYPEWERLMARGEPLKEEAANLWLPVEPDALRAGFYACTSMLELMESVYLDLDLEEQYDHPDNRGWINLFRHWSGSGMFRVTYAIACSTFGARFQEFCARRLALIPGEVDVEVTKPVAGESAAAFVRRLKRERALNFAEADQIAQLRLDEGGFDELVLLRLAVLDPSRMATTSAGTQPGMTFTFGFALGLGKKIVYMRVQDHLRKMGLGQRALKRLMEADLGYTDLQPEARAVTPDAVTFRRLFELARPPDTNERSALPSGRDGGPASR
jgi:hypothetical protein